MTLQDAFNRITSIYSQDKPMDLVKNDFKTAIQAVSDWLDVGIKTDLEAIFPSKTASKFSIDDKLKILEIVLEEKLRG